MTKTDEAWSDALEAALTATPRSDLRHGTNAAYVAGCVCTECREHQRQRMAGTVDSTPLTSASRGISCRGAGVTGRAVRC
jgi:hypothetical protein